MKLHPWGASHKAIMQIKIPIPSGLHSLIIACDLQSLSGQHIHISILSGAPTFLPLLIISLKPKIYCHEQFKKHTQ